jgi:hypothetical protein
MIDLASGENIGKVDAVRQWLGTVLETALLFQST